MANCLSLINSRLLIGATVIETSITDFSSAIGRYCCSRNSSNIFAVQRLLVLMAIQNAVSKLLIVSYN